MIAKSTSSFLQRGDARVRLRLGLDAGRSARSPCASALHVREARLRGAELDRRRVDADRELRALRVRARRPAPHERERRSAAMEIEDGPHGRTRRSASWRRSTSGDRGVARRGAARACPRVVRVLRAAEQIVDDAEVDERLRRRCRASASIVGEVALAERERGAVDRRRAAEVAGRVPARRSRATCAAAPVWPARHCS